MVTNIYFGIDIYSKSQAKMFRNYCLGKMPYVKKYFFNLKKEGFLCVSALASTAQRHYSQLWQFRAGSVQGKGRRWKIWISTVLTRGKKQLPVVAFNYIQIALLFCFSLFSSSAREGKYYLDCLHQRSASTQLCSKSCLLPRAVPPANPL